MDNANPFDFNDLSDLPKELQEKLTAATNGSVDDLVKIIAAGKEAGFDALTLNQVKAAGMRMGMEMPTDATIRNWLNTGVEQGKLTKPSRQTYAIVGTVASVEEAPVGKSEEDFGFDDPLADL